MYHEEKIINDVLCWRGTPNGEWHKFSDNALTDRCVSYDSRIAELEAQKKRLVEALGNTNIALSELANDLSRHGGYAGANVYKIVNAARALLAEVEK